MMNEVNITDEEENASDYDENQYPSIYSRFTLAEMIKAVEWLTRIQILNLQLLRLGSGKSNL